MRIRHDITAQALLAFTLVAGPLAACDSDTGGPSTPITLTDEITWAPTHARSDPSDKRDPRNPDDRASLLADGFGDQSAGAGEAHTPLVIGAESAPAPGKSPHLVTRFVHFADLQLADDESPARVAGIDGPGPASSAYRPQDAWMCLMVDAMVREFNAINAKYPLDLVLLGGDNADNAQKNELSWVLQLLGPGGTMSCDSGADDDPIPGPDNDPKDPFDAAGLDVPYLWVTGNHDVLVQGNIPVSEQFNAYAIGSAITQGTRDWSQPGGPVVNHVELPADPARALNYPADVMTTVHADGDGHGLDAAAVAGAAANYVYDLPGTPVRFVVLDTAARSGGAGGVLKQGVVDNFLIPALDEAMAQGKYVFLASHHATSSLTDGDQIFGDYQPDAVLPDDYIALITSYPNVLFNVVGHSHRHRIRTLEGPDHSVVEIMTSALADFPHEARLLELWDEDNGWLRLRTTCIDMPLDRPLVAEARALGVLDWTSGWADENPSDLTDRNVDIWVKKP